MRTTCVVFIVVGLLINRRHSSNNKLRRRKRGEGAGGTCFEKIMKKNFGQLLCKIRAFFEQKSCKNSGILLIFPANITKIRVF